MIDDAHLADEAVALLIRRPGTFTAKDVTDLCIELAGAELRSVGEAPNVGAALRRASAAGVAVFVGMQPGRSPQAHGRPVRVWRGVEAEAHVSQGRREAWTG